MTTTLVSTNPVAVRDRIRNDGFARLDSARGATVLTPFVERPEWPAFATSWSAMPHDTYMADGGRYRRRRYRVYRVADDHITLGPHQPHFQSLDYNNLNGGIERWFEPIADAIAMSPVLTGLISMCHRIFSELAPQTSEWHVEVHQFRIEAEPGKAGNPTPEGMHRDGTDYVMVMMISRHNIASGTTTLADDSGKILGSFMLTKPGDGILLDDRRVFHGVTPVVAVDASAPAYRDVLVVTFRDAARRTG